MNKTQKILVYSNPFGWIIGIGIFLGVMAYRVKEDIKTTTEIYTEE